MKAKEASKVAQAYERAAPVRTWLHRNARCMEVTEDKCGIVWERWIVGSTQVIIFSTPHFTEIFRPLTDKMEWKATLEELDKLRHPSSGGGAACGSG